jgi:hypothetical protein
MSLVSDPPLTRFVPCVRPYLHAHCCDRRSSRPAGGAFLACGRSSSPRRHRCVPLFFFTPFSLLCYDFLLTGFIF